MRYAVYLLLTVLMLVEFALRAVVAFAFTILLMVTLLSVVGTIALGMMGVDEMDLGRFYHLLLDLKIKPDAILGK